MVADLILKFVSLSLILSSMKKLFIISSIILFQLAADTVYSQTISGRFKDLDAILGLWSLETSKGTIYESWYKSNDSTLLGKNYSVKGKDTVLLETVDLLERNGKIMYIPVTANQNDQKPVIFTLSKVDSAIYTFENPTHDFPKRIIYTLPANNLMHAWIEGSSEGVLKRSDYRFKRVK